MSTTQIWLYRKHGRLRECYAARKSLKVPCFNGWTVFLAFQLKTTPSLELGDLLMEIKGAKEDGCLTGLSYLDTSRGIGPIVDKLPFGLQDKWVSTGSWYKEKNHGHFPPFEYFCNFVCHEAKKRKNPSFMR